MLEIKNYNSSILHEISFSLKENENLIILGENWAGKSTLAKVLSNLISNDKVELLGENIKKISDLKRTQLINYIPPKLSIFDEYVTLREFLELSFIGNVNNQKIDEVIKLLNLRKLEDKSIVYDLIKVGIGIAIYVIISNYASNVNYIKENKIEITK